MVYGGDDPAYEKTYTKLEPKSRHSDDCPHRNEGTNYLLCRCPKWAYGVLNGKDFRRSLGTRGLERALERIARLERAPADVAAEISAARPKTVPQCVALYVTDCRARSLAESTVTSYQTLLNALSKWCVEKGRDQITDLSPAVVDTFRQQRKNRAGKPITPNSQRKELENLRAFFKFCTGRKMIPEDPSAPLKPPKEQSIPTQPFAPDEVPKLLAASWELSNRFERDIERARRRAYAFQLLMLHTGLRISDVARLTRAAFDPTSKYLTLRILKNKVPLSIKLPDELIRALGDLPKESEYWLHSGKAAFSTTERSLARSLAAIKRITKIHCHPHRYRDTFASQLLTNGADIRTVQMALGHQSIKVTEKHYGHFVAAHQHLLDAATATLHFTKKAPAPVLVIGR